MFRLFFLRMQQEQHRMPRVSLAFVAGLVALQSASGAYLRASKGELLFLPLFVSGGRMPSSCRAVHVRAWWAVTGITTLFYAVFRFFHDGQNIKKVETAENALPPTVKTGTAIWQYRQK